VAERNEAGSNFGLPLNRSFCKHRGAYRAPAHPKFSCCTPAFTVSTWLPRLAPQWGPNLVVPEGSMTRHVGDPLSPRRVFHHRFDLNHACVTLQTGPW